LKLNKRFGQKQNFKYNQQRLWSSYRTTSETWS